MVGHKKDAIEEKSLLNTLAFFYIFQRMRGRFRQMMGKRFHNKLRNVRTLSHVEKDQREAGAMYANFIMLCFD
jgi:hypothetical protein